MTIPTRFYNIRSASDNPGRGYINTTALIYTDADNTVKWDNEYDGTSSNAVWTIETDGANNYYAKNIHTGMYLNGLEMSEVAADIALSLLGDDQFIIRANGNMLHAQDADNVIANWDCTSEGQQNKSNASAWYIDEVESFGYNLYVGPLEWSTLILGYNAVIPENVACYALSEVDGSRAGLTRIEGILPANTAVLVNAVEGNYTFTYTTEAAEATSMLGGTLCKSTITPEDGTAIYMLSFIDGIVGLYPCPLNVNTDENEDTYEAVLNNANKAYLAIASNALFIGLDYDDTTYIENVENANEETVIYDLVGRRVQHMNVSGVYIVNGKKVSVK